MRFEHTQINISLPKQCVSLPKLNPEDPWTQNYEAKQWNLWIFSNNKKWNYASSDPVTCEQRNLDSDHTMGTQRFFSRCTSFVRAKAEDTQKTLHNNPSYSRILIGSRLWSIRGQTHDWRHHYKVFLSAVLKWRKVLRIRIIFYVTG